MLTHVTFLFTRCHAGVDAKLIEGVTGISSALYQVDVAFGTTARRMSKLPGQIRYGETKENLFQETYTWLLFGSTEILGCTKIPSCDHPRQRGKPLEEFHLIILSTFCSVPSFQGTKQHTLGFYRQTWSNIME